MPAHGLTFDSAATAPTEAEAAAHAHLCACRDCGLFQLMPAMTPGASAHCLRCNALLRRTRRDSLGKALALNLASLILLLISATTTMMIVSTAGIFRQADLFSGPAGLEKNGVWELSVVVLFTTVAAPLLKLLSMVYVLAGLQLASPPRHLRRVFAWVERLRPWSMIEVYLLGVAVAYVKLAGMVHIDIGPALYALIALMLAMVAADAVLDHHAVWEEMERRGVVPPPPRIAITAEGPEPGAIACDACTMVSIACDHGPCPRCGSTLEARKPNAIARTWALMLAAAILYIPANIYPVLTVIQFGAGAPSTILGGVVELLEAGQWPLAALVFFASVLVPMLKLVGLTILLISTQMRATGRLRDRTVLYRIVNAVGRWSMIDIFMESILVALVQFGALTTIDPGFGAIAFAGVVVITMFAAESFDPRLMWDAAAQDRPA